MTQADSMEEVSVGSFDLVGALPRPGVIWNVEEASS